MTPLHRCAWTLFVGGSRMTGGGLVSLSKFLFLLCCYIPMCLLVERAHLLELMAPCVWSIELGLVYIYVGALMAVSWALAMLLPQLLGQSVDLLNANATVIVSLQHQVRTVLRVLCRMATRLFSGLSYSVSMMAWCILGKNYFLLTHLSHPDQIVLTK